MIDGELPGQNRLPFDEDGGEAVRSKVISKIKKLLSLSGNNPNPEESKSAMAKAQRLLAEHRLSMSDLELEQRKDGLFEKSCDPVGDQHPFWKQCAAKCIADNFGVSAFITREGGEFWVSFVGAREDIEIAEYVYRYAVTIANRDLDMWVASQFQSSMMRVPEQSSQRTKNDFLAGWVHALSELFRKNQEEMAAESGGALVVVKSDTLQKLEEESPKLEEPAADLGGNPFAQLYGYMKGKQFSYAKGLSDESDKAEGG